MTSPELAKKILADNSAALYGIFGFIETSGFFPPRAFLNEFLMVGFDPRDQDGRMPSWTPFELSDEKYNMKKEWWIEKHPGTVEDSLGVNSWHDWVQCILGNYTAHVGN